MFVGVCIYHARLLWLGPGVHRQPAGQNGPVVGGKPEPEFLLDPVKFRVGESGFDRADGSEPQPPHRFLTETAAIPTRLIKIRRHDATLYPSTVADLHLRHRADALPSARAQRALALTRHVP